MRARQHRAQLGPEMVAPARYPPISQPIGWASIFAAATITIALTLFLHLLGIGIGLTSIQPGDGTSLRSVGIGTGIWSIAAPIIALFIGGLVAGRTAPTLSRMTAAIHGAAAWAVTSIIAVVLIGIVFGAISRGASMTASAVANTLSAQPLQGVSPNAVSALQIDRDELVARLNKQLAKKGMPQVERANVDAAIEEATRRALFEGGIDRATVVDIAARHTALSREQVDAIANELDAHLHAIFKQADDGSLGPAVALPTAEGTGKVVLGLSLAMLLGLFAAMCGAAISVRRDRRSSLPRLQSTT